METPPVAVRLGKEPRYYMQVILYRGAVDYSSGAAPVLFPCGGPVEGSQDLECASWMLVTNGYVLGTTRCDLYAVQHVRMLGPPQTHFEGYLRA